MFGFEGMNPQRCSNGVWIRFPHVGPVAQLVRASPCHGEGRRFESDLGRFGFGILAQLGEHLPYKQRVTGSSPVGPI